MLSALVNEAMKQLGAALSGGVRPSVTSWQTAQATPWFPELRWEAVYGGNPVWGASNQVVGCALAAGWQAAQEVTAVPPANAIVPDWLWHDWQSVRSLLAVRPWKPGAGSVQAEPRE